MSRARIWVAVTAAIIGIAVTISLGNWQTRRAAEKLALQETWDRAGLQPPLDVTRDNVTEVADRLPLRVRVSGRYLHEHEIWLDNRQMGGRVGFNLLTPLRQDNGAGIVLVNRGFAPRDPLDRVRLPPVARSDGAIAVVGLAVAQPSRVLELGENAPARGAPPLWQNLDYEMFERASGLQVQRWVVQQTASSADGLSRNWPRPSAGIDKHRGYALQWYSLAALIAALMLFFGVRARRRSLSRDADR